jgi:3-deoxy-D-manno-octulosonic-acid transferase
MYVLYTVLLILIGCAMLPRLLWRSLQGAGYHRDLLERFGYGAALRTAMQQAQGCLWFHAASVGEIQGLQPIITSLRECFPTLPVVCSTFTPTGKMMAQRLIPEATSIFLLPFDLPWIMRRVVQRLRPRAVIVQETELWPHWFRAAAHRQVPVVLVNGRLSPRSMRRYVWIRRLMQHVLADVTLLLVQSQEVARRFRRLGAAAHRLKIAGNTNIDRALLAAEQVRPAHALAPLVRDRRLLVAGSTHEGEETIFLEVYQRLRPHYPDLLLVIAPRHMERIDAVVRHVQAAHCQPVRRSMCTSTEAASRAGLDHDHAVLILDTLGELAALYQLCTVAFVGGSLVPIGGHNILEPAVFAKPLLFGPHMHHFPEIAQMLCEADGAVQVHTPEEVYTQVEGMLQHPDDAAALGQRAFQALQANRGALVATRDALVAVLQRDVDDPAPPVGV